MSVVDFVINVINPRKVQYLNDVNIPNVSLINIFLLMRLDPVLYVMMFLMQGNGYMP